MAEEQSFEDKCEIFRTTFQLTLIISPHSSKPEGVYLFYNPPYNFHRKEILVIITFFTIWSCIWDHLVKVTMTLVFIKVVDFFPMENKRWKSETLVLAFFKLASYLFKGTQSTTIFAIDIGLLHNNCPIILHHLMYNDQ